MRLLLVVAAFATAVPTFAAQAVAVSVEELSRSSDAVVRGRVRSFRAHKSPDGLRIYTTYEIRAASVLRGKAPKVARVIVPGGVVGDLGQRVDAAPTLDKGEDVVVFLRRAGQDGFTVSGLAQGKFSVVGRIARPDLSNLTFIKTSVGAGERRVEEMPLAELERRVRSTR